MFGDKDDTMTNGKRIRVILHLSAGGAVALAAILADYMPGNSPGWGLYQVIVLAAGLVIIALGFVSSMGVISRASTHICLLLLSLFLFLALCEGVFRTIGFDFARQKDAWLRSPLFYRQPIVPTGEVFFRRPGPEEWTGQVLHTRLMQLNILPNPYSNEAVITVKYNRVGFRNLDNISDWDIVVAGDSFTELGHLRNEELFTTILGKSLNVRVLNLGTSYTGPLTQLSYLRDYGISGSTKHAFIVFFEGNDLDDLAREYKALIRWRESGQRDYREFKRQPSAARALYGLLGNWARRLGKQTDYVNAYFKSLHGDIQITLTYAPLGRADISEETRHHLNYFFGEYARFRKERQITVWLAYMPSKERVLHGQVEFSNGTNDKLRNWRPTDLPALISELCDQYGIKFIDLTSALIRETSRNKQLLYNSIYDAHLNSPGSLVVGQELARHFLRQNL
jgi:hypothetical protein